MASYDSLVNSGGTIFNQAAKVAYSTPDQLAADLGTTASGIQWGNIAKAGAGFNPTGYSGYTPPNTSAPVPSSNLNTPPLVLPSGSTPDNGSGLVNGVVAGLNASQPNPQLASDTQALDKATADYNSSLSDYTGAVNNAPKQADLLSSAENANNVPQSLSELQQINTQLAEKTAAWNNLQAQTETKGIESGTPATFWQGEKAAQSRQAAVEIGGLAAIQAAKNGNYQLAESRAIQTANAQFADAQAKIDNTYKFLQLNQDTLSKAQATVLKDKADAQNALLTQQKDSRTFALSNGVTTPFYTQAGTIYKTSDGKAYSTPEEFFADGGARDFSNAPIVNTAGKDAPVVQGMAEKYPDAGISLGDNLATAQAKLAQSSIYKNSVRLLGGTSSSSLAIPQNVNPMDAQVKAIIANNPGEYGNAADAIDVTFGKGTATKYDSLLKAVYQQGKNPYEVATGTDTITAMAEAMIRGDLAPSQLPGFGQNSLRAQALAKVYQLNPTFDAATAEQQYAFGKSTKTQGNIAMGQTALQTIQRAVDNSEKVNRTQITWLNNLVVGSNIALSDPTTAQWITDINALGDEIGTVLGQGSATDFKTQLGLLIANKSLSKEAFKASMQELSALFTNRINGQLKQAGQPQMGADSQYSSQLDNILNGQ